MLWLWCDGGCCGTFGGGNGNDGDSVRGGDVQAGDDGGDFFDKLTCSDAHVGTARPTKADPVLAWVYFIDEDEDADDDEDNANDNQQLHPP